VKVRQYVYLGLKSDTVDPGTISERLGLMPDEVKLMASKHPGPPPVPRTHLWRLNSGVGSDEVALDEHFDSLLARVSGSASRIRELIESGQVDAVIQVVRHFTPGPEDPRISEPGGHLEGYERLRGQHPLVGFGIESGLVAYAAEAGITFDFDEYGDEDE
jgi:Domain of unknown function (DUF4279)